jgi:predicted transposase/invertase (TIGR01784 family)
LKTRLDKWLYFIKHLEDFQTIPSIFKDAVFTQAFEKAELARFGAAELDSYEMNLKVYRDYKNTVDTAFDDGKLEGKIEEKIEIAKNAILENLSNEFIAKITGLSPEKIEELQAEIKKIVV